MIYVISWFEVLRSFTGSLLFPCFATGAMNGQFFQSCGQILIALLLTTVTVVQSGKVLVFPVDGSHWVNMNILVEALHAKGHNVTVIRMADSWYIKEFSPHYTSVTINSPGGFDEEFFETFAFRLMTF